MDRSPITVNGTLICGGYVVARGITVDDVPVPYFDGVIINQVEHPSEDLVISLENRRVSSLLADWEVTW